MKHYSNDVEGRLEDSEIIAQLKEKYSTADISEKSRTVNTWQGRRSRSGRGGHGRLTFRANFSLFFHPAGNGRLINYGGG